MFKQLLTLAQTILTLAKDLEQNRDEIKEVRKDLLNLTLLVQRLSDEIRLTAQHESSEREKLVLQLQNELLKTSNRLPSPRKRSRKISHSD